MIFWLPLTYLSWFLGKLANLTLPKPLATLTVRMFSGAYGIDSSLATRPIEDFRSIGDFFTRDLRPELRPMGDGLVSPVDGTLRSVQNIEAGDMLTQVKGKSYSLESLLGDDELSHRFVNGQQWNFYLSPKDAHHIHAPIDGRVLRTVQIPGKLWPVNDWALRSVEGLFAVNERIVSYIDTALGLVAVVMVGATNVGRISLAYSQMETNLRPWAKKGKQVIHHNPAIPITKGAKLGTFKMGSSVIVLTENRVVDVYNLDQCCSVLYGQPLADILRSLSSRDD
jgi:phosphatidylserine decarboxylase